MLDTNDKKLVQDLFADWDEIQDQRKELNESSKEITKKVAEVLDTKATVVNKLFRFLRKKQEDGQDELDVLNELAAEVEN